MRAGGLAFCLKALDLSSWDSGAQGGAVDSLQDSLSRYSSAKACVQVSVLLAHWGWDSGYLWESPALVL